MKVTTRTRRAPPLVLGPMSALTALALAVPAQCAWYNGFWLYRKAITIDHTKVSATLTDFPVLVSITDTDLRDDAQSDGDDILFTSSDETTKLSHEIEKYTSGTGALVAWVKVPSLSSSTDTTIYMYYGNSSATNQQSATGVWDSNFVAVWHLKEDPSGSAPQMLDSTSGDHDFTSNGSQVSGDQVAGKIGGCLGFDGSNDYLTGSHHSDFNSTTATISFWLKPKSTWNSSTARKDLFNKSCDAFWIILNNYSGNIQDYINCGGSAYTSTTTWTQDTWYWVTFTQNGGTNTVLVNGSQERQNSGNTPGGGTNGLLVGGTSTYADAYFDEIRFSKTVRSSDWIATEYANQNSPGTFLSVGSETSCSAYDGSGTLTTTTSTVTARSTGTTIAFTYTAGCGGMTSGAVTLAVASGWNAPSTTGSDAGYTTASAGSVSVNGQTITVSSVTLSVGATLTITYGSKASGGPGATVPNTSGAQTWQAQQKATSGGTLTNLASSPSISVAGWYNASWGYRKAITIDHTKVSATLTDFPVLISITDTDLRDRAQSDGDDILFTSSNGSTKLSHEIEKYTSGTGTLVAWVKVSSLSNATDTVLYMYYGYASASSQQNATGVWDSSYKGVWHLKEDPSGSAPQMRDSTSNANHGTSAGSMTSGDQVTGKVDGSLDFDGSDDKVTVTNNSSLDITSTLTAEAWIKSSDGNGGILSRIDGGLTGYIFAMGGASGNGKIAYWNGWTWNYGNSTVNDNAWHHIVLVHSGTTGYYYKDGAADGTVDVGTRTGNGSVDLWMGIDNSGCTTYLTGILDELRLSSTNRSADWIATEYANQSSPSTFYSAGSQETAPTSLYKFLYRKTITIDHTKVGTSCAANLSNFPLLINISSDTDLRTVANSGHVENSSGHDIIFRSSDGVTQLDHEIEKYTATTGELVAWVRIPTLSYSADTTIYLYYGCGAISSSTQNRTGVWDSNYKAVWHLLEGTGGSANDSTSNGNNGTLTSTTWASSGKLGPALTFGSGSQDNVGTSSTLNMSSAVTVSAWAYPTGTSQSVARIFIHSPLGGAPWEEYTLVQCTNKWRWSLETGDSLTYFDSNASITANNWYHLVATWDGSNMRLYINGSQDNYTGKSGTITDHSDQSCIGYNSNDASQYFVGTLDEIRVSNSARPACWIETEYANQNSPSTFYSVGSETAPAPTAVTVSTFTAQAERDRVVVRWETKSEVANLGFNLYRSAAWGPLVKLNAQLIPGLLSSVQGRAYRYEDCDVVPGIAYGYTLEDIDLSGTARRYGPAFASLAPVPAPGGGGMPAGSGGGTRAISAAGGSARSRVDSGASGRMPPRGGDSSSTFLPAGGADPSPPTAVEVESFEAEESPDGVLLEWRTGREIDNLGFHVHRDVDGRLTRITPDLIAGSALLVGAGMPLAGGRSYSWIDPSPPDQGCVQYWLEDIDLDGKSAWHGPSPIAPRMHREAGSRQARAVLLSDLGGGPEERDRAFRKVDGQRQVPWPAAASWARRDGSRAATSARMQRQWAVASQGAVKLEVKEDGWYRVEAEALVAAGMDPRANPRNLQLFADGEEQPLLVSGQYDRRLDPGDAIEFYGNAVDTPWTGTRTYWLLEGTRPGRRIPTILHGGRGEEGPRSFPLTVERKERRIYFAALRNGEEENFFGSVLSGKPVEQILSASNPDLAPPGDAVLEVSLQGVTAGPHEVRVSFNGVELGCVTFEGQVREAMRMSIEAATVLAGENCVTLAAQGGEMDVNLVDAIRLTYWRTYTAEEDCLACTAQGGQWLSIDGFRGTGIRVADVTDVGKVRLVKGVIGGDGRGYSIRFKAPSSGLRRLLAFCDDRAMAPAGIALDAPSSLHAAENGADLVVVGPEVLLRGVAGLAAWRQAQGFSVARIEIADVYDEFGFGMETPWALKEFLRQAYDRWSKPPVLVLLVGDATFDPRDHLGLGVFDHVPTKLLDTAYLETASDDWFADADGDGHPEMAVGRLPVRSAAEAALVADKIVGYDGGETGPWAREILFASDANDRFDFEEASLGIEALIPGDLTAREIFRGRSATARADLISSLNRGALLVHYIGHGSAEVWQGGMLGSRDAGDLTNGPCLPFFVNMTCLNGFFHDPYTECMGEALLKAERGGAIAVWASSGLTAPEGQVDLGRALLENLFGGERMTIGEAILWAKRAVGDPDIRRTWILFGDPSTRLR